MMADLVGRNDQGEDAGTIVAIGTTVIISENKLLQDAPQEDVRAPVPLLHGHAGGQHRHPG